MTKNQIPGLVVALAGVGLAWLLHTAVPAVPELTLCVILGIVVGNLTGVRQFTDGVLKPGLSLAAKRLMRLGIVLLGLKLSLVDIAGLGWVAVLVIIAIVLLTFFGTLALGKLFKLPGHQPLLVAAGFSICGASAIGAFVPITKSSDKEAVTPVALVTLCGTLAIFVLPALQGPLGLSDLSFGHWVGASVHDVGQVVATAQTAGTTALTAAVVVKLTRVLMLAPMVAGTGMVFRRNERRAALASGSTATAVATKTPIVPLFVAGFLAMVVIRTLNFLPASVLGVADIVQTILLGAALFGLGAAVKIGSLVKTGGRAVALALCSWVLVAALALLGIQFI